MKAVILAGGEGKRLRPLTNERPKSLVELAGRPILDWQIRWFADSGVDSFVILAGYMKEKLVRHLGDGKKLGVEIEYAIEKTPLGTAGALKNSEKFLHDEEKFFLINGDIITNLDLRKLSLKDCIVTISLARLRSTYGVVKTDNGRVVGFDEKPLLKEYWLNAGVYLMSNKVFAYLPGRGNLENTTFPELANKGLLGAVKFDGIYWWSIDSIKDLEEAGSYVSRGLIYKLGF